MTAYSETRRQIVHVSMAGFALLLRYLTWPQAAAMAVAALVFNLVLLARLVPGIIRPSDRTAARAGTTFYPLSVLLLVLLFRHRLDLVAAAWGVMAFGDGFATLVGTRLGGTRLPWNDEKTWSGLAGGFVAGAAGAVALASWVGPSVEPLYSPVFIVWGVVAAAAVASLVETIPVRLDDNLSVPFAAGLTLALGALIDPRHAPYAWRVIDERMLEAISVNAVLGLLVWLKGLVTFTGALAGAAIGILIYLGAGLEGWVMLLVAFVAAVASSHAGLARKQARGIAEERGGRRGAGNAIANCLVGAFGAWAMLVSEMGSLGALVLVTGLVAGASDTVASEIGKAWGGQPRLVPSFRAAPPGTPGAVSTVGTLAGIGSAVLMTVFAVSLKLTTPAMIPIVTAAATAGAFAESALAARYEARGILNNDLLNFLNTAVAAAVALGIVLMLPGGTGPS